MILTGLVLLYFLWLLNKIMKKNNHKETQGPFGYTEYVLTFKTKEGKAPDFIMLYNNKDIVDESFKVLGSFLLLRKDLENDVKGRLFSKGLTIEQIQCKYALPNIPNKLIDVRLPGNVKVAVGKANKAEINGKKLKGGGRIYMILDQLLEEWFPEETVRNLDEYIESIRTRK